MPRQSLGTVSYSLALYSLEFNIGYARAICKQASGLSMHTMILSRKDVLFSCRSTELHEDLVVVVADLQLFTVRHSETIFKAKCTAGN